MNLFELFVKTDVDDQASGKLKDLGGKLGNGLKTAAKIGTAAVGAAAAGITALTTAAVNNYAEYEQLVGGVETLFKGSADKVQEYAANAYKTAGMSANEYMSTVTSFSASLLQSLGGDTDKAAEYANQALTDMSDNANKMGTSMELIQNAYNGFAKANYTMLDNLKLGYGGTKEEMARLIKEAAAMTDVQKELGIAVDATDMSFGNIVNAISVVQKNMKITGTTADEAGRTIAGSVQSMKSAWQNLLTGLADGNANIEDLVNNLVETVVGDGTESNLGVLGNILPAVKAALKGAAKVVSQSAPIIAEELPKLMEEILPDLASATANLIVALAEQIPSMAQTLVDAALQIVDEIGNAFAERIPGLSLIFENLETVIISLTAAFAAYKAATAISGVIDALRKATEGQTIAQTLLNAVMNANPFVLVATLIAGLVAAIITLWNTNEGFRNAIITAWETIRETATSVFTAVANFFTETIPNAFQSMVDWIREGISSFISIGSEILTGIYNGIVGSIQKLYEAAKTIILTLAENIIGAENLEKIISLGADLINALSEGIENVVEELVSVGEDVVNSIKKGISNAWEGLKTWFNNLWDSLFKNRTVDVDFETSNPPGNPGANGFSYVPYDGFPAILHEGERVLTAEENKAYNRGATGNTSGITIIQNIQTVPQTPVEFAAATEAYFEQARWAFA